MNTTNNILPRTEQFAFLNQIYKIFDFNSTRISHAPPKVHFANERTFLHWMQFVTITGALSVGLLNFGDYYSSIAGVVFTIATVILMFYALIVYLDRARRLEAREKTSFEDYTGILLATGLVFGCVGLNLGLKLVENKFKVKMF